MEPGTEVLYKASAFYYTANARALAWDDPEFGVDCPLPPGGPAPSERDGRRPRSRDLAETFG